MFQINSFILKSILFLNIFIYIYAFFYLESTVLFFDSTLLLFNVLNVVIISFLFFLKKETFVNLKGQLFRISIIFTLGYLIVYFQIYLDFLLGNFDFSLNRYWVNERIILKSSVLSAIGIFSFYFGYLIYNGNGSTKFYQSEICTLVGYKVLSFVLLSIFILTVNPLYVLGGYGKYELDSTTRYASVLFELSITATLVQNIINLNGRGFINLFDYLKSLGLLFYIQVIIYLAVIISSGDRGPLIYLSVAIISSYIIVSKTKFSIYKIILLGFFASLIISSLVNIRKNIDSTKSVGEILIESIFDSSQESYAYVDLKGVNSFSSSTLELATSVKVFHLAVDNISDKGSFFYGQFQLLQLVTIIPLGQQVLKNIFDIPEEELTSAAYITKIGGGVNGEYGTSCLTDIYLDFGMIGILLMMIFFGYFIRFLEVSVYSNVLPKLIILISFLVICQYAIYIPRATIMFTIRNIIWVYFIIKFIQIVSPKNKINAKN